MPDAARTVCIRECRELAALDLNGERGRWQVGCRESRSAHEEGKVPTSAWALQHRAKFCPV